MEPCKNINAILTIWIYNELMIKLIAAVDNKLGIANNKGIPWKIDADKIYYRQKISSSDILLGRGVYDELKSPVGAGNNYVLTHLELLRPGFIAVRDIDEFFEQHNNVWVIGGSKIYEQSLAYADQIYLTHINKDFSCTKFFPDFQNIFSLSSRSKTMDDNGLKYEFSVYDRKNLK